MLRVENISQCRFPVELIGVVMSLYLGVGVFVNVKYLRRDGVHVESCDSEDVLSVGMRTFRSDGGS